jgi:hypothetical protein
VTFFEEEDIPAMLEMEGHTITLDGTTVPCLISQPDEELFDEDLAPLLGRSFLITIHTGDLPTIAVGKQPQLNGLPDLWNVVKFIQQEDGAITNMLLARVP